MMTRVHAAMTPDVYWCHEDDDVREAARMMEDRQVRRLPVMDRCNRIVGIVSIGDVAITAGDERLLGRTIERVSEPAKPGVYIADTDRDPRARTPDQVNRRTVAGIFGDRMEAERAIDDLRLAGVNPERVGVITKEPERARDIASATGAATAAGAAGDVGIGAILGGAAGWLIGIGALAIPGIGRAEPHSLAHRSRSKGETSDRGLALAHSSKSFRT